MSEQMAIIRNVGIGARDVGRACLWFDTYITESSAALQIVTWEDAAKILAKVYDVKELEGRPCVVDVQGQIIKFVRLWQS
jgi:hypothetical protein